LASRTLGLDRDNAQSIGLERTFDSYLKGEEGQRLMQRVTGGAWIPVSNLADLEGKRGADVVTTIDPEIIVLGGMVQSAGDLLLEPLRYECARRMSPDMYRSMKIELAALGADAPAIGAARQALSGLS
jgi:predicted NBD/HSP70 family sugar kinase